MEALRKNPNVLVVLENRLSLTIEFRQQIYAEWVPKPERSTVRKMLEISGFDTQQLGRSSGRDTGRSMKKGRNAGYDAATVKQYTNHPYI